MISQVPKNVRYAGHGTLMRALAHGLPMVCMPMGRDQLDNAALLEHHGAGIKLSSKAKYKKIRKAVERTLADTSFKENAKALQKDILADALQAAAEESLEALVAN